MYPDKAIINLSKKIEALRGVQQFGVKFSPKQIEELEDMVEDLSKLIKKIKTFN